MLSQFSRFGCSRPNLPRPFRPRPKKSAESRQWAATHFDAGPESKDAKPFFSFTYDGRPSAELLKTWKFEKAARKLDEQRTEYMLTYSDPKTGLQIRCVAVEYADFPVVEWTLYFKNTGDKSTPILENIQGLDAMLQRGNEGEFVLHCNKGDWCAAESYEPYDITLGPKAAEAVRARRRAADQRSPRLAVFQSANARRRHDPGGRLAGAMGKLVHRATTRPVCNRGRDRN